MKTIIFFLLIVSLGVLFSCNNKHHTLELGNGKDVIVSMDIQNHEGIKKIEFQSNGIIEIVSGKELRKYKSLLFGLNVKGEGAFQVCVFTKSDTICSPHYVESGYRPKLEFTENLIKVVDHIGYSY